MKIAGIDYSLTSPAICTWDERDGKFCFENCRFFFLTTVKKYQDKFGHNISGTMLSEWHTEQMRYEMISEWSMNCMSKDDVPNIIGIEGYSMGSKGKVFNLAENCGILKHKIWKEWETNPILSTTTDIFPPTTVKKFATGKGNADKESMYRAFIAETGVDLMQLMGQTTAKVSSPVSDIVDAFYMAKYALENTPK